MIRHSNYNQPLLYNPSSRPRIEVIVTVFTIAVLSTVALVAFLKIGRLQETLDDQPPKDWLKRALEIPNREWARQQMHKLSNRQSLAGSEGDPRLAKYVEEQFRIIGVPRVDVHEYKVLLSSPISCSMSMITEDHSRHEFNLEEPEIRPANAVDRSAVNPYIAYSASGNIKSSIIYVNYGRKEDFDFLVKSAVNLTNHIGIARYGKIFRGLKTMLAERYGMIGLIIYSDPDNDGSGRGDVYPDGKWRPPKSIQGGSSMFVSLFSGDPLTPGVAAVPDLDPSAKKFTAENSPVLPRIPVLAIGYKNADKIFKHMKGPEAPEKWQGGLSTTYRLGPGPIIEMDVKMDQSLKSIFNVVGSFDGSFQPDRRIIMGNHRDAWVYGAVDPHSGTVPLLQSARTFAQIYKEGWRPKRTLQICSWDAEEFGLVGSTEFVEQFEQSLQDESVAYLNVDEGVSGNDAFRVMASPIFRDILLNVTKLINFPSSDKSVYDLWTNSSNCTVDRVGSGSDYSGFLQYLGISSVDFSFSSRDGPYGVYHSKYDDINWYESFADPQYNMSTTLAKFWTALAISFTDTALLPFRITPYALALEMYLKETKQFMKEPVNLESLDEALLMFIEAAQKVDCEADFLSSTENLSDIFQLNDRLAFVERRFLMNNSLPDREEMFYRHSIYAPDIYKGYGASVLPGLKYALNSGNSTLVEIQANVLKDCILNACNFLLGR